MPSAKPQALLFYIRKAPYASTAVNASLDIVLTAAAFDQDITLVFAGDGVYQLLTQQDSAELGLKNISQVFPALELYEVNKVFVEESALITRGLSEADLLIPVTLINHSALSQLMATADQVFSS